MLVEGLEMWEFERDLRDRGGAMWRDMGERKECEGKMEGWKSGE